eukprot:5892333-Prymnesium_polylepis.1
MDFNTPRQPRPIILALCFSLLATEATEPELILHDEPVPLPKDRATREQIEAAHASAAERYKVTHSRRMMETEQAAERRGFIVQIIFAIFLALVFLVGIVDCRRMWRRGSSRRRHGHTALDGEDEKDV